MMISRNIAALMLAGCALTASAAGMAPVIPAPAVYVESTGSWRVPSTLTVSGPGAEQAVWQLGERRFSASEIKKKGAAIRLVEDKSLPAEGYRLEVDARKGVEIAYSDLSGLFYAVETLTQLLRNTAADGSLQACSITDEPRFGYRGMMIDVVRCYLPVEELKKLVDVASMLKINNFHLHLTDDNGWRMQIDKYPALTEVGAWRVDREEIFPERRNPSKGEPATYGGYYTKDELRDLVDYAAKRRVNVLPEIEMPAHSMGALASYPELACPVVDRWFGVTTGIGGKNASIIMCGGNDKSLQFVKDVLEEVLEVFPSPYIHIGGDEAAKDIWDKCPKCRQRIADLGLEDSEGLQAWFMDSVNAWLRDKGRTAIGWDEVTIGKPKEDIVIMGWQGTGQVAVNYARQTGRRFIMTPARNTYLIRYQGPQWFEPFSYFGNITLEDAYNFEPVKDDWSDQLASQLMGIQGSMWTEFCRTPEDVQYMVYPRMMALADVAWRTKGEGDYPTFISALDPMLERLAGEGITHAPSMYNVQHTVTPNGDGTVTVKAECARPDLQVQANGTPYTAPYKVTGSGRQTLIASNGKATGRTLVLDLDFNKATGRKVSAEKCTNGLQDVLINGLRGSTRGSDFEWAGWYDCPVSFTVDLGEETPVESISLDALGNASMNVALPSAVRIFIAGDDGEFTLSSEHKVADSHPSPALIKQFESRPGAPVRYIKVEADNPGAVPDGYPREGNKTWMYFDEIIVN